MCNICISCVRLSNLLVQRGDLLNGGVQGVDVHSLLCVRVEVKQSSHEVLNEAQSLTCQVTGFKLNQEKEHTQATHRCVSCFATVCFLSIHITT